MLRHARLPRRGAASRGTAGGAGCDHVAVGTTTGKVVVVDVERGGTVAAAQHAPEGSPVLALKYSPCGKFLGLACGDGRFRVLDVHCGYKLVDQTDVVSDYAGETVLGKPASSAKRADAGDEAMTHVDWSSDSRHVQINTLGGGLKFFWRRSATPSPRTRPRLPRRTGTWTLPYGWASRGVWAPTAEVGDVNAVRGATRATGSKERVLAVADDFGFVVWRPANVGVSNERAYRGHSARHVVFVFRFGQVARHDGRRRPVRLRVAAQGPRRAGGGPGRAEAAHEEPR